MHLRRWGQAADGIEISSVLSYLLWSLLQEAVVIKGAAVLID